MCLGNLQGKAHSIGITQRELLCWQSAIAVHSSSSPGTALGPRRRSSTVPTLPHFQTLGVVSCLHAFYYCVSKYYLYMQVFIQTLQTAILTKSELAVSSSLLPWKLEGNNPIRKGRVSNVTATVVTWYKWYKCEQTQYLPFPPGYKWATALQSRNSMPFSKWKEVILKSQVE